jgi:hypothetical protein
VDRWNATCLNGFNSLKLGCISQWDIGSGTSVGEDASDNVDSDEYLFFSLVGTGTGALEILLLLKNDESLPVVDWTSGGGAGLGWAGFLYVTFSNPFTNALGKGDTAGWLGMEFFLSVDEERERDCEPRRAFFCW